MSNSSDERADSTRSGSDSLISSMLPNSPIRNPWSVDDSPPAFPKAVKKPTKSLSSVYDAYTNDNEYSLFQDFVKLNIDDVNNSAHSSMGSSKSSNGQLNSFAQSHNSAPSPPLFVDQQNYFQQQYGLNCNNHPSNKNTSDYLKKNHAFASVASDSKIYENANHWNNNVFANYHQGSDSDLHHRQV